MAPMIPAGPPPSTTTSKDLRSGNIFHLVVFNHPTARAAAIATPTTAALSVSVLTSEVEDRTHAEPHVLLRLVRAVLRDVKARREAHRHPLAHLHVEVAAYQRRKRG